MRASAQSPALLLGLHIQCSFLFITLHSTSETHSRRDQTQQRAEGKPGKSNRSPKTRDDWAPANHQGIIPSGLPSNPENRSPFKTRFLGGEKPGAPGLAKSLRKANRLLHPDLPRVCAEPLARRPFPSPSAGTQGRPGTTNPRQAAECWAAASPAATQLPGGGAAHRASIRERRRGREERLEEEAGFKRKAVTPHKRFL